MSDNILTDMKLICDEKNPNDKKILLLATLIDRNMSTLTENQDILKKSINGTDKKLDTIMETLNVYKRELTECPFYEDRKLLSRSIVYIKNPKLTLLAIVGLSALFGNVLSISVLDLVKHFIGL